MKLGTFKGLTLSLSLLTLLNSNCTTKNHNVNSRESVSQLYCHFTNDTITYSNNWTILELDFMNDQNGFVARFVNKATKSQYTVKNKIDNSNMKSLSPEYYSFLDSLMLSENPENRLIDTSIVDYRNGVYNRREYLMNSGRQGWYKQVSYSQLDSNILRTVQLTYPVKGSSGSNLPIPDDLIELDSQIKLK